MAWDFAEANPLADAGGSFSSCVEKGSMAIAAFPLLGQGHAVQANAGNQVISLDKIVSTDPPYYDNIGYADLSDFFYVWLRRSLGPIYPSLYATLTAPKLEELGVSVSPRRKAEAESFFKNGMTQAI